MKNSLFLIVLCFVNLLYACNNSSQSDLKKLNELNNYYSGSFIFKFDDQFYIKAISKNNSAVNDEKMKDIYKKFFFNDQKLRRQDTAFVYLNVYDSNKKFLFQLSYDNSGKKFVKSKTEHY